MTVEKAYDLLFSLAFPVVGVCILLCILRSAMGPKITDRLLCVNMNTTMAVSVIVWLAVFLGEDWLGDVALVYVLLGVVGTAVLVKVFVKEKPGRDAGKGQGIPPAASEGGEDAAKEGEGKGGARRG